jgi:hypothetical protein
MEKLTEKQREWLIKFGLSDSDVLNLNANICSMLLSVGFTTKNMKPELKEYIVTLILKIMSNN